MRAARKLARDSGTDYAGAMKMIYDNAPGEVEAAMADGEPVELSDTGGADGIEVDGAGHALPAGQDPTRWQPTRWPPPVTGAPREAGPDSGYAHDDAGKARFLTDRRDVLESTDGGRSLIGTLEHQAARRERIAEGVQRSREAAAAERVREQEAQEKTAREGSKRPARRCVRPGWRPGGHERAAKRTGFVVTAPDGQMFDGAVFEDGAEVTLAPDLFGSQGVRGRRVEENGEEWLQFGLSAFYRSDDDGHVWTKLPGASDQHIIQHRRAGEPELKALEAAGRVSKRGAR